MDKKSQDNIGDDVSLWTRNKVTTFLSEWKVSEMEKLPGIRLEKIAFRLDGNELSSLKCKEIQKIFAPVSKNLCQVPFSLIHPLKYIPLCSASEITRLQISFSSQFIDSCQVVSTFIQYTEQCLKYYKENSASFIAPYIAIVQSSGTGKSRLLREVARHRRTMYVCMRSRNTGYPERTEQAIDALFSGLNAQSESEAEEALVSRLRICEAKAFQFLTQRDVSESPLFESEREATKVWNFSQPDACDESFSLRTSDQDTIIYLVIDEAKELLDSSDELSLDGEKRISNFRLLCRALAKLHFLDKESTLFLVLLDTLSKMHNFEPATGSKLSSGKMRFEPGPRLLFSPFLLHDFHDVFLNALPTNAANTLSLIDSDDYLNAGRPLLKAHSVSDKDDLDFLLRKLKGGWTEMKGQAALSLTLCRLALSINQYHSCASQLVAENMATILATDLDRESMLVTNLAEPKLAISAASLWYGSEFVETLLPALEQAMITGAVTAGTRGEIVAQLVVLLAVDVVCREKSRSKRPGDCVYLKDVLIQLLPEGCDDAIIHSGIPESLRDAKIACAQFVKLGEKFGKDTLVRLAERHCGASFREYQPGCDLVLSIFSSKLAALLVQVKNLRGQEAACIQSGRCCVDMMPSISLANERFEENELAELDENCVRLYFQIGASTPSAVCKDVVYCKGLKSHEASAKADSDFWSGRSVSYRSTKVLSTSFG